MQIIFNLQGEPNELVQVLKGLFAPAQIEETKAIAMTIVPEKSDAKPAVEIEMPKAEKKEDAAAFVKTEEPETKEAETMPEKKAEPETKEDTATISDEDLRVAMKQVRNRIEYGTPAPGEEKGPNEEPDATLHRTLNTMFKNEAKRLGAEKPTALPQEMRQEFIDTINNFQLNADNSITPF